jgi:hypothetical protein
MLMYAAEQGPALPTMLDDKPAECRKLYEGVFDICTCVCVCVYIYNTIYIYRNIFSNIYNHIDIYIYIYTYMTTQYI